MRTLKTQSTRATVIRTQERMDQQYLINVTRNIMGELEITHTDLEKHPRAKDFSQHVFQNVLHHIKEWNSTTLGKIVAYGLGKGETSKDIPLRRTSLEDAWHGSPLEPEVSGGLALEWLAATTIVAAAYDLLLTHAFVDHLKAKASSGGRDEYAVAEIFLASGWKTKNPKLSTKSH
ncbi:MAG: hypothetical protein A3C06_03050 [Candidatus Taylorbacteria bacterium RIFCSPHIGHO2_02_FULL_46_13]|uniref:Uncharacterized protein n=1 Tax=Candidatus Taylorbacteria bacterium RIFCSPHIGHO2_02_FULL_46_13 TaxID=1802312 RepID=A0A1G2MTG8_9BACT|nr:MAG: hypothetical protein A3C06_03050 [Candidatus Taylorbacteria bacterium RIFCSPHIGHO2_02_FULL_46_13]